MAKITNISTVPLFNIEGEGSPIIKTFGGNEAILEVHIYDFNNNLLYSEHDYKDYYLPENETIEESSPLNETKKEPKIVNPKAKGAGDRDYKRLGPNNSKDGYWFNTGYEMVWVSTATNANRIGEETPSEISMDPILFLNDRGYNEGQYKLKLNFYRKKIYDFKTEDEEKGLLQIKEISPSRTEIRVVNPNETNNSFDERINQFISEIENSSYFREFVLNFKNKFIVKYKSRKTRIINKNIRTITFFNN